MRTNELMLYKNMEYGELLLDMTFLMENYDNEYYNREDLRSLVFECVNSLLELSTSHGFEGNLWHTYLTFLLASDENAYSTSCEIVGPVEGSINEIALHDFAVFKELFDYDFSGLKEALDVDCLSILMNYKNVNEGSKVFNKRIRDRICGLAKALGMAGSVDAFKETLTQFYREFGVGKLGLHKAFRVEHPEDEGVQIVPITNIAHVHLDDLVGYEIAKKKLIDNTRAFVEGRRANNCLLFGDAGTGKSSSIKAILNQYYDQGLRMIEVYKHQFQDLNDVIAQIKNRNYKFIIYMDDLSFEEFEIEYKYLKAVIEGGLEKKPKNVLIYATSNRRHLVRETFKDKADRDEELHTNDTVQEKLSLVARFGVTIYFGSPSKKEFQQIVKELAKQNQIDMPEEELLLAANKWELTHGGLSGRTAQQFIDYLLGCSE
ncbi:ATP-binding protein [Faecalicatena sp. AGMB00832]|uniref:ATP-binding protein n=1 Tax=Faecalicatena faecalis TaxID=2726362 RepID=A0ABS6D211_9FIRM|nr:MULTISPECIES: ATP-binding protein [Faecalicatena]MBU3875642.1 ATP-binding protein [Faecalicatena faecalis]MCI6466909.1 ATP-binding protein [Faecalicatena sp.]MDY5617617.1 ATP-binding protein [Lachnospiraceae bacterium]